MKIQYLVETCYGTELEHQNFLNRKSSEGWELCNVIKDKESTFIRYYFKKYVRTNLLNDFFNSKSDANKYLTAEQQEDLEKDFDAWFLNAL